MKRYIVLIVLCCWLGALQAQNTKQLRNLRNRREQLQKKIKQSERQLKTTRVNVKRGLSDLAVLNGQIEAHQKSIQTMQHQVDSLGRHAGQLKLQMNVLSRQLADKKQRYRRSMVYLFNNRKAQNKLLFILSSKDFNQMMRRWRYVREYSKYQRVQGIIIHRKEMELSSTHDKLVRTRNEKNRVLGSQQAEKQQLVVKQGEQQKTVNTLQKQQRQLQNTLAQNKKEMAQLNAKIDYFVQLAIAQERARREAAERKRREAEARERARREAAAKKAAAERAQRNAEAARKGSKRAETKKEETYVAEKPETTPIETYNANNAEVRLSQSFAANKGRLPMPINGPYVITAHYGSYNVKGLSGVRLDNKGINITARGSATARCIFNGEVSMIFSYGGMMNVLVRHGSYISVYCNLSSVSVSKGQHVSTRQTIGNIARDESGRATLHFQLRKETSILNPEAWLGR
jgi:septal ring factor EnvC (AmiA/AmiB activator)